MGLVEDPFEAVVGQDTNPGREYFEEHTVGAIYIPAIHVSLPLFDETNYTLLKRCNGFTRHFFSDWRRQYSFGDYWT